MTMTADNSPPPSPDRDACKPEGDRGSSATDDIIVAATSLRRPNQPIPLPLSAVNRNLCYNFPSPPLSTTSSSPRSPTSPRTSPVTASARHGTRKHTRNSSSRAMSTHSRRRSSLSTCSFHASQLEQQDDFGPPPHPAPTTPLPPVPGAPRIPFTTPQQERNRYSSYELMDKLRRLETAQMSDQDGKRNKRHSAPPLRTHGHHVSTPNTTLAMRRLHLDSGEKRELILARRASREDKLQEKTYI